MEREQPGTRVAEATEEEMDFALRTARAWSEAVDMALHANIIRAKFGANADRYFKYPTDHPSYRPYYPGVSMDQATDLTTRANATFRKLYSAGAPVTIWTPPDTVCVWMYSYIQKGTSFSYATIPDSRICDYNTFVPVRIVDIRNGHRGGTVLRLDYPQESSRSLCQFDTPADLRVVPS